MPPRSPVLIVALLALACEPPGADSAPGTGLSDDTAVLRMTPGVLEGLAPSQASQLRLEPDCGAEDPPDGLVDPVVLVGDPSTAYRVVELDTPLVEHAYVLVSFPSDPAARAYDAGAPVVVVASPAFKAGLEVSPYFSGALGLVELQPIYPGWYRDDLVSSGEVDRAGPLSAQLLTSTLGFAAGQVSTADGLTLRQLTGGPVCDGHVTLFATSSGLFQAAQSLADLPAGLGERLLGLASYESPHTPQTALGDLGSPAYDPDLAVDADGNGVDWDDARRHDYAPGDCDGASCDLDLSTLAWDPAVSMRDVHPDLYSSADDPGVLFLDRDGSGALELGADGGLDVDGDGRVGPDEDMAFVPFEDPRVHSFPALYSVEVLQAALEQGVLSAEAWPAHVGTPDTVAEFWAERSPMDRLDALLAAAPAHFRLQLTFSSRDHGVAQQARPHVAVLAHRAAAAGVPVRFNPDRDTVACLYGDEALEGWAGELGWGELPAEGELHPWALPHELGLAVLRPLAAATMAWEAYGPFDRCPG